MTLYHALMETVFFLACAWLRNPASGKLECRWSRVVAPIRSWDVLAHFSQDP